MGRQYQFEIQTVDRAFAGSGPPEDLWRTVARSNDVIRAAQISERLRRQYTPQPGAWSGHVRVLRNGSRVAIKSDYSVHEIDR